MSDSLRRVEGGELSDHPVFDHSVLRVEPADDGCDFHTFKAEILLEYLRLF